jgi:DHA1 family tetracycline resistance protein-like MFS transporter
MNRGTVRRSLGLVFFIMLMDVMGISMLYPVAPYLVLRYSNDALMVTMLTVLYAAAQFFAAPVLGKLGDRCGRRPVLLISVFGSAVGYVIFGIGGALWILFLARLIDGITGGNMSTASAYIADVSAPEDRAKNFTLIGLAWGLGLVLGPAMGALLGEWNLVAPAFVAAGLSLLSVLLGLFLLPESLPRERRETAPIRPGDLNPFASIRNMARKPGLGGLLLVFCLFQFTFNGINSTESLFMIQKFNAQPWQVGLQLALIGIALAVVQALLIPRLIPRHDEKRIAITSLSGQAVGVLGTFLDPIFWLFYPITIVTRAVTGLIFPTLTALTANRVSASELGALMGVTTALGSLMSILGPLWAGVVYGHVMRGSPYWMGAVIYLGAALVLARMKKQAHN